MIQHITREIPPSELASCIAFYGLLGFEPVPVPAGIAGRAVWLERAHTQIHLMPGTDSRPERGHVGVVAQSYDATLRRLRGAGHEVQDRRRHWGAPRSYVRDPAGNLVELMAWPPGSSGPAGADHDESE